MRVLRFLPFLLLFALGIAPSASASGRGGGDPISTVADGLNSPRHLAFGDRGDLFVAEAGTGGPSTPCFVGAEGPGCWGMTGSVTKIPRWGRPYRIAEDLPSMANTPPTGPTNTNGIGPHGITVIGDDTVVITNGGPTEIRKVPVPPETEGAVITRDDLVKEDRKAKLFGTVLLIGHRGRPVKLGDIYDFELRVNPDAQVGNPAVDTNPVGIIRDGKKFIVADAGGNAIDTVDMWGRVRNLAVFPNVMAENPFAPPGTMMPMQAVPTSVVEGPDGQYYVSQLTGFPFPVGAAKIFKVNPRSGAVSEFASGFTNLMDLAFGRDGTLYALSIDDNGLLAPGDEGAIYRVSRDGTSTKLEVPAGNACPNRAASRSAATGST